MTFLVATAFALSPEEPTAITVHEVALVVEHDGTAAVDVTWSSPWLFTEQLVGITITVFDGVAGTMRKYHRTPVPRATVDPAARRVYAKRPGPYDLDDPREVARVQEVPFDPRNEWAVTMVVDHPMYGGRVDLWGASGIAVSARSILRDDLLFELPPPPPVDATHGWRCHPSIATPAPACPR